MSLRMRLAMYDTPLPNSELRFDVGIGTEQTAAVELYKRWDTAACSSRRARISHDAA